MLLQSPSCVCLTLCVKPAPKTAEGSELPLPRAEPTRDRNAAVPETPLCLGQGNPLCSLYGIPAGGNLLTPSTIPHACQPQHKYSFALFQEGLAWPVTHKHLTSTNLNSQMDLLLSFHPARPFAFSFSSLLAGTAEIFTTALALQQTSSTWNSSKPTVRQNSFPKPQLLIHLCCSLTRLQSN